MARTNYLKYLLLWLSMTLSSCELHTSGNGNLDGLWQGMVVEDLQTGELSDMRDNGITWSFQGNLLYLRNAAGNIILTRFELAGDVLRLYAPHYSLRHKEEEADVPVEDAGDLVPYGISSLEEYFKVLELNSSTMRLESSKYRISFRKY